MEQEDGCDTLTDVAVASLKEKVVDDVEAGRTRRSISSATRGLIVKVGKAKRVC